MTNPFEALENKLDRLEKILTNLGEAVIQNSEPQTEPTNKLVKIEQAATQTGYKKGYIYELVHRNAIPYIKRGRSVRFDPEELEAWMRADRPNIIQETIKSLR
jgi:excisionase family DNA binding protein